MLTAEPSGGEKRFQEEGLLRIEIADAAMNRLSPGLVAPSRLVGFKKDRRQPVSNLPAGDRAVDVAGAGQVAVVLDKGTATEVVANQGDAAKRVALVVVPLTRRPLLLRDLIDVQSGD